MEPTPNYAVLATPIFAAAIVVEVLVARRRGRLDELYWLGTAISDVSCGAVFQTLEVLLTLLTLPLYARILEHAALVRWDEGSPWPWVIGMLGVDFLYYWWHRVSHVVNVMWAVHGVHHQSEDYNLAVALRQPVLEPLTWFLFTWVLALFGVPPLVLVASFGANLFYQFWIHTELVDRLPRPLEWVLNTPSHHRVHHGVDPEYLDRNYGGVLIVWDRLFGTFQAEHQRPTYGTTVPLRSYDPLWGNAQHLHRTWRLSRAASRPADRVWAWFAHPAWLPRGVEDPDAKPDRDHYAKYRPSLPPSAAGYVMGSVMLVVLVGGCFVFVGHGLPWPQLVLTAGVLVLAHIGLVAVIEGKRWALAVDWLRIVGLAAVAGWLAATLWGTSVGAIVGGAAALVSIVGRVALVPVKALTPSAR